MTAPATATRRIGVFGGAFDPPHRAHVALARAALEQLGLDELRIVPTGQAWHKSRVLTPAGHRLAMAELAFAALPRVRVDPQETLREGPSFTIDTLRALHAQEPGAHWFLLLGQDQARALPTWRDWTEVLRLAQPCVALRPDAQGHVAAWTPPPGLAVPACTIRLEPDAVSATAIRRQAAQGLPVGPLVGDAVAGYIADHHLYIHP